MHQVRLLNSKIWLVCFHRFNITNPHIKKTKISLTHLHSTPPSLSEPNCSLPLSSHSLISLPFCPLSYLSLHPLSLLYVAFPFSQSPNLSLTLNLISPSWCWTKIGKRNKNNSEGGAKNDL